MHIKVILDTKCLILEVIVSKMNIDKKKGIFPRGNAIYKDYVLTTLLVDGGYVSFTKSGTGANATSTTNYLEGKVLFRIFATESIFAVEEKHKS